MLLLCYEEISERAVPAEHDEARVIDVVSK